MENLLTFNGLSQAYTVFGHGAKPLLAFHGFGRSYHDFKVFEKKWGDTYTIYAFNNFHHGNSIFPKDRIEDSPLRKEELLELFTHFFVQNNITRFSILGYSMGGKVALTLLELFPERVDSICLFAPDGFKVAWWYKFASGTKLGNWLYKYTLHHPGWFFFLAKSLFKLRLVGEKLYRFAMMHIDTHEKRQLVYDVWMTYRKIIPDLELVKANLVKNQVSMYLFFGNYDRIIEPGFGENFMKLIAETEAKVEMHTLPVGHNMLVKNVVDKATEIIGI
jgi:pimeloyl-ACP methyl ester carboxylesterase